MVVTEQVLLHTIHCCKCGVLFAFPDALDTQMRKNGETFYCPTGHPQWYGKSEADKLRDQLAEKQRLLDNSVRRTEIAEAAEQRANAAKAKAERSLKKTTTRIAAGVCPCCNRTFQQLARHMANKHPEVKP